MSVPAYYLAIKFPVVMLGKFQYPAMVAYVDLLDELSSLKSIVESLRIIIVRFEELITTKSVPPKNRYFPGK